MAEFRHVTNLYTPYDGLDEALVVALGKGGKIGPPVAARSELGVVATPLADLIANGVVGLYVTYEALLLPEVGRKTGWGTPPLDEWNKLPLLTDQGVQNASP
jgi:hypothetical protein